MPFKWLAPETFEKRILSTPSDVWSFAIVLWEIFTLGAEPFNEINDPLDLHRNLVDGYRLEKPNFSTAKMYDCNHQSISFE